MRQHATRVDFQACAIDRSAISPFRIDNSRTVCGSEPELCQTPKLSRSLTGILSMTVGARSQILDALDGPVRAAYR